MHAHLAWWLPTVFIVSTIAGAVFGLQVAEWNPRIGLMVGIILSASGICTVLVTVDNTRLWPIFFGWLALIYVIVLCVLLVRSHRAQVKMSDGFWRDHVYAALYSFGLVVVVTIASRAYVALWGANSAATAVAALAAVAVFAAYVGGRSFKRLAKAERDEPDGRGGQGRLVLTILTGVGALVAAVPVFVLLGKPLGIEIPTDTYAPTSEWVTGINIGVAIGLSLIGVVVAAITRPRTQQDDLLRVNWFAACLVGAPAIWLTVLVLHDVLTQQPSWPVYIVVYIVALALFAGILYAEDFITTAVRLHFLRHTLPAWILTVIGGGAVSALVVWMIERQLWVAPGKGVTFSSAAITLGQVALGLVCVAAINFVLAFSSAAETQQVTVKAVANNVLQGQALYAFLIATTCWLPSLLIARLNVNDLSQNIKPFVAFIALTWLLYRAYLFTTKMNADHFASELKREAPQLERLAHDEADLKRIHGEFHKRLRKHLLWQDRAAQTLFVGSLVFIFVTVGKTKGVLEDVLPTERATLSPHTQETDEPAD